MRRSSVLPPWHRCTCDDVAAELDFSDRMDARRCTRLDECGSGLGVPLMRPHRTGRKDAASEDAAGKSQVSAAQRGHGPPVTRPEGLVPHAGDAEVKEETAEMEGWLRCVHCGEAFEADE